MGTSIAFGFLLCVVGHATSKDCNYVEFGACVKEVLELETGDFHITSEEQMKEVCKAKQKAIQCSSSFVSDCMEKGARDVYEATTGGKVMVVEEMCTEGSRINRGYLRNIDCWGIVKEEIDFCNEKFNGSQRALTKADMEERIKFFHGCCAFEWHRKCLAKAAREKCGDEAGDFVHDVSTALGGSVLNGLCSASYKSCHGLYEDKMEGTPSKSSRIFPLATAVFLAFLLKM